MKICLIRNDKMGDMILTLPVVQGLKQANQDCKIDIVCSQKNQKICKNYKSINKIFLLQNKHDYYFHKQNPFLLIDLSFQSLNQYVQWL